MPTAQSKTQTILAFGAHPDDIEFGCGGVIAHETEEGRPVHFVICSRGEASTHGTPEERVIEANSAAQILGATLEFLELDGDAHLELRVSHSIRLARIIREIRPTILLAPSFAENQHPDHSRLGHLVRDASRLARYGGLNELKGLKPHTIDQLFFYAVSPESIPPVLTPLFYDVSSPNVLKSWISAMEAHKTQVSAKKYIELQLTRARYNGSRVGVDYAIALYSNAPLVLKSFAQIGQRGEPF